MRKFIVLLCFAIIACNVSAQPIVLDNDDADAIWDDVEDAQDTDDNVVDDDEGINGDDDDIEEECEDFCPRIYLPICVKVNDSLATFATECELNNKIRCEKANSDAAQAPTTYSILHHGPCGNE